MSASAQAGLDRYHETRARLLGPLRTTDITGDTLHASLASLYPATVRWSLYGRTSVELGEQGFRVLGRTALEAVPDAQITVLSHSRLAGTAAFANEPVRRVLDFFAGSGNFLYQMTTALGVPGAAAEADPDVRATARHNLRLAGAADIDVDAADYRSLLATCRAGDLILLDPPWGTAYSPGGLDLSRTAPPIPTLLRAIRERAGRVTVVVKSSDAVLPESRARLAAAGEVVAVLTTQGMPGGANTEFTVLRLGGHRDDNMDQEDR